MRPEATGQRGAVTAQAALRAAAWCDYLEAHARRCYGLLVDDGLRSAQALADKVSQGKRRTDSQRATCAATTATRMRATRCSSGLSP